MQSALVEHASNAMHGIDWEKTEVVECHPTTIRGCPRGMAQGQGRTPHQLRTGMKAHALS